MYDCGAARFRLFRLLSQVRQYGAFWFQALAAWSCFVSMIDGSDNYGLSPLATRRRERRLTSCLQWLTIVDIKTEIYGILCAETVEKEEFYANDT